MANAAGGSINLRLGLRGADEVKRELASIGPAGAQMGRQLDHALRQPGDGLKALDAGMVGARGQIANMAGSVGILSGPLAALGPVGMAAGVGLAAAGAAASLAFSQLKEAATWAAGLTDTADRIGVTTEALQTLRYVADETGIPIEALESGLQKLNASLGAFQTGVGDTRVKEAFERLGISRDDLVGIENASDLLPVLADALAKVEGQAERVQLAKRLGVAELEPMLRRGASGLADLGAEGEATGHVLANEVIAKLDETDRALERNEQQIANNVRSMQANLSPFFVWCSDWLAKLSRGFTDLLNRGAAVERRNDRVLEDQVARGQERVNFATRQARDTGRPMSAVQEGWVRDLAEARGELARRRRARTVETEPSAADRARASAEPEPPRTRAGGGGGGGRRLRDTSASDAARDERETEQRRRRAERVDDAITRAKEEQLAAAAAVATDLAQVHSIARQRLDLEQASATQAQERFIAEGRITDAQQAELRATLAATQAAETRALEEEQRLEREAAITEAQNAYTDMTRQVLEATAAGATTAAERRAIELQLLEIAHKRLEADLRAQIAAATDATVRESLVAAYDQLPVLKALQTQDVERRNAGALDRWREKSRVETANIGEFLTDETLDAIDGLNRGLIDALKNVENAGDAFSAMGDVAVDALGRVVDALLEVAMQKMLIDPLINGLFGGPGKSGSGLLGSFLSNLGGSLAGGQTKTVNNLSKVVAGKGMARGGLVGATGLYPTGEFGMELAELPAGARIYDTDRSERMLSDFDWRMQSRGAAGGGGVQPIVNMPVTIINKSSAEVSAQTRPKPGGGVEIVLQDMMKGAIMKSGADGTLQRALKASPQPIRR